MSLRPKTIAWWDLETTGNGNNDQILEVGIVVTDMGLNVLGANAWLNPLPLTTLRILDINPVVLEMHVKSGLWTELQDAILNLDTDRERTASLAVLDARIAGWLIQQNGNGTQHMAFAGSGVGHFDRKYIDRDLPLSTQLMTYWPLDVGVIRRMASLAQIDADLLHEFTQQKPHRALDDAWFALTEARAWVNRERELRNLAPWTFSDEHSAP